ncbi:DNA binding [Homalodisca vitripennis]|nr:DNA binding [Homalodisca vitripennis]
MFGDASLPLPGDADQRLKTSVLIGKSLPVHCIVESIATLQQWKSMRSSRRTVLETDSYVIIPVNTTFQDLVQVALQRLGYPKDNAYSAKGSVVLKNWKPLSFDKIAESPLVTVGDILGELTTVATLRIQIFRPRTSVLSDMKDKLLRLLMIQSHALLLSSGCPLDESRRENQSHQTNSQDTIQGDVRTNTRNDDLFSAKPQGVSHVFSRLLRWQNKAETSSSTKPHELKYH